jgi:hypothetical protein
MIQLRRPDKEMNLILDKRHEVKPVLLCCSLLAKAQIG